MKLFRYNSFVLQKELNEAPQSHIRSLVLEKNNYFADYF